MRPKYQLKTSKCYYILFTECPQFTVLLDQQTIYFWLLHTRTTCEKYKCPFLPLRIRLGHPVKYYIAAEVCMTSVFPYADPCVGYYHCDHRSKNAFIFALLTTFFHYYTIIYSFACTLLMQLFSQNRITIPIFDHENNPSHLVHTFTVLHLW